MKTRNEDDKKSVSDRKLTFRVSKDDSAIRKGAHPLPIEFQQIIPLNYTILKKNRDKMVGGKIPFGMTIVLQNLMEMPSLRGKDISVPYVTTGSDASKTDLAMAESNVPLSGSMRTLPGIRGTAELITWVPFGGLGIINFLYAGLSTFCQSIFHYAGIALMDGVRLSFNVFTEKGEKKWWQYPLAAVGLITSPLAFCASQIFQYIGNALAYSRHLLDSVTNLFTCAFAKLKDIVTGSRDYGNKYPTAGFCAYKLLKSAVLLAPTLIILGLCLIPGGQFSAIAIPAIKSFFTAWVGFKTFFTGLLAGAAVSVGAQVASGALRAGVYEMEHAYKFGLGSKPRNSKDISGSDTDRIGKKLSSLTHDAHPRPGNQNRHSGITASQFSSEGSTTQQAAKRAKVAKPTPAQHSDTDSDSDSDTPAPRTPKSSLGG